MHIYLLVPWWKVVIYDDRDLLNINTAGQHVSGDQNSRRARLKVLEVCFTIRLWFFAMLFVEGHESIWKFKYRKSGVLTVAKAGSCRSSSCVRSLSTFSRVLQKTTVGCVKVGVVYRSHKVSSFQSSLSMRMKNCWIPSSVSCSLLTRILMGSLLMMVLVMARKESAGIVAESKTTCMPCWGRCSNTINTTWRISEDSVRIKFGNEGIPAFHYLNCKPTRQHLVCLVKAENLDLVRHKSLPLNQVAQPAGRTHDDINTFLQFPDVLGDIFPSDTGITFDIHMFSNLEDHLLCLLCQFSSRHEYKRLGRVDRPIQLEDSRDGEENVI